MLRGLRTWSKTASAYRSGPGNLFIQGEAESRRVCAALVRFHTAEPAVLGVMSLLGFVAVVGVFSYFLSNFGLAHTKKNPLLFSEIYSLCRHCSSAVDSIRFISSAAVCESDIGFCCCGIRLLPC